MPEYLYAQRGRMLLSWRQVLNRHARLIGKPTFAAPKRWYQFWRWFKKLEPLDMRQPSGPFFYWSGLAIPWSEATNHFFVMGASGSGKSLLFRLMKREILPKVASMTDHRAAIFDPKGELMPYLLALGIKPTLIDPYDERSVGLDFADDFQTPAEAQQFAALLVPTATDGKDSFWSNATRLVLAAVTSAYATLRPGKWTLRDVLLTMQSSERIEALLSRVPETAHVWKNLKGDPKTEANLLASFATFLGRYEVVAALFEKAKTKISIRRWAKESGGVLLIPNHPRYRETLAPIHRLLIQLITDETLSLPDNTQRRTFLFLDELRSLGKIECLYSLSNEGRSKGVCLVVGSQSIEGLQEVYGEKLAQEIVGQLRSKIFLRNDSHHSAKWIEDHIGQVQYLVESISHSSSSTGGKITHGTTTSHQRRTEPLILASEIMSLPTPKPGGVFTLVNDLPSVGGCFYNHYGFEELVNATPRPSVEIHPFTERPKSQQRLLEWSPKDIKRLSLPAPSSVPSPVPTVEELFHEILAESANSNPRH